MNPFGPILRSELVRIARRQRLTLMRCAYVLGLVTVAVVTYATATKNGTVRTRPQELAPITAGLFYALLAIQFLLAVATPNWTADAIAGEKERRTLPFLLLTPLADWQIVVGKLTSRLAQITLFVLAGLPVLCALQFFGGVEPALILLAYAVLAVSVLSLGSLAVLCSVYARTARLAGQRAGQSVAAYLFAMYAINLYMARWPPPAFVQDLFDWLDAGNPLALGRQVTDALRGGWRFADTVLPAVGRYMIFHVVAAGVFIVWAARKLRPIAAEQAEATTAAPRFRLLRPPPRPSVADRPVLWKALYFDFRQVRTLGGRAVARLLFVLSFIPVILVLVIMILARDWRRLPETMNGTIVRGLGTMVLCGVLVIIAANSSASIAVERRKKTFDELVLTELSVEEILGQKWWASIVVIRWALVWVGIHWVIALVCGGLHWLAVPLLIVEWTAYAAFAASLGIYCAARWPQARKAGVFTGVLGFMAVVVPIMLSAAIALTIAQPTESNLTFMMPAGASPPVALALSGFYGADVAEVRAKYPAVLAYLLIGTTTSVLIAAALAWRLWRGACRRFPRAVG
jgi:hypothetical protein